MQFLRNKLTGALVCLVLTSSCTKDRDNYGPVSTEDEVLKDQINLVSSIDELKFPAENDWNAIPQDPKNPINIAKVELGKFLFHETGLAIDAKREEGLNTYSCASCHHAKAGFQSGILQGIGEGGSGFGFFG
jgi:cytochrome c peroxidase